jgi:hypothetical protein
MSPQIAFNWPSLQMFDKLDIVTKKLPLNWRLVMPIEGNKEVIRRLFGAGNATEDIDPDQLVDERCPLKKS